MEVVFALLIALFIIGLSARKFTNNTRLLILLSIGVMILLISFTHYGG